MDLRGAQSQTEAAPGSHVMTAAGHVTLPRPLVGDGVGEALGIPSQAEGGATRPHPPEGAIRMIPQAVYDTNGKSAISAAKRVGVGVVAPADDHISSF